MKHTLRLVYEHKTANNSWIRKEYATTDGHDWERVVRTLHENPHEYRVIHVSKEVVEYSIVHKACDGEWVEEGLYFDTYEDAAKALKDLPGQPKEKYRIVEERYQQR